MWETSIPLLNSESLVTHQLSKFMKETQNFSSKQLSLLVWSVLFEHNADLLALRLRWPSSEIYLAFDLALCWLFLMTVIKRTSKVVPLPTVYRINVGESIRPQTPGPLSQPISSSLRFFRPLYLHFLLKYREPLSKLLTILDVMLTIYPVNISKFC